ncbi:hypothetical protein RHGRI_001979 [Rhododendron griersonianum]|uniref:Uncharacterized protein n=1 Tax=Rhododendron griersonianum TaxID=479676 RepID=A0AAV6LPC3_9ERIC|nr:hypothetical protein RHGRI_001979 [Rhododendron griersonianum]
MVEGEGEGLMVEWAGVMVEEAGVLEVLHNHHLLKLHKHQLNTKLGFCVNWMLNGWLASWCLVDVLTDIEWLYCTEFGRYQLSSCRMNCLIHELSYGLAIRCIIELPLVCCNDM